MADLDLDPALVAALPYLWTELHARPEQIAPPGAWRTWVLLGGRGLGKTRAGAEWVRSHIDSGTARRVALVSDTARDVRDVMVAMLEQVSPPWNRPKYEPSKSRLVYPNGATCHLFAAEAPELLRGPAHDLAWADELAKWKNLRKRDIEGGTAWDNLQMGLRRGTSPRACVTTTPRSVSTLRQILGAPDTVVTRGSTFANAENLPEETLAYLRTHYEGTRLGRQELHAELLEDIEGALWTHTQIDATRVDLAPADLRRVVIAIDPAVTATAQSDETGILACGLGHETPPHGYVLEDVSGRYTPDEWADHAIALYHRWSADRIVAEVNNGGDLVGYTLKTRWPSTPFLALHASRGKRTRAEPISALYEQGRVHHVGLFPDLEDQLCTWDARTSDDSPDRMDAMVWAFTELLLRPAASVAAVTVDDRWQYGLR